MQHKDIQEHTYTYIPKTKQQKQNKFYIHCMYARETSFMFYLELF